MAGYIPYVMGINITLILGRRINNRKLRAVLQENFTKIIIGTIVWISVTHM